MKLFTRWGSAAVAVLGSVLIFGAVACEQKAAVEENAEGGAAKKPVEEESGKVGEDSGNPVPGEGKEPKAEQGAVVVAGEPGAEAKGQGQPKGSAPTEEPAPGRAEARTEPGPGAEQENESKGESGPGAASVPVPQGKPEAPAPKERWTLAHAGFAAHLPPDVDLYLDARKLNWVWDMIVEVKGNALFKDFLNEWMGDASVREEYKEELEQLKAVVPLLLKDEVFLAARGVALPAAAAVEISAAVNRSMGRDVTKALASGEMDLFMMNEFGSDAPTEIGKWLKRNIELLGKKQELALYAGGRMGEEDRKSVRERIVKMLAKLAAETGELEAASWEAGGVTWSGFEIAGKDVPALESDSPPEGMDEETWAEIQDAVQELKVTVACAEVGEFVVLAAGLGRGSILLAEAPDKSLAAGETFGFFEEFDAKAVRGTTWVSKKIVESLVTWNRGLPSIEGVEAGLKDAAKLRRREEMLKAVREFIAHLKAREAGTASAHLGAVLGGDELRYETRGGWLGSGLDLTSPLEFAGAFAGLDEKLFLRAHWKMEKDYVDRGNKQVDSAMRLVRLASAEIMENLAKKAEEEEGDEETAEKMARWKRDLLKGIDDIWEGYRDHFGKAFGEEWALLMDLEGEMIPAVGVDEDVVRDGRIPRIAVVRPVLKREALSESWEKWNGALTNMFGIVAEAFDQPIPFPDTMTAEKDDLRTYFFPFPFASDDFLPSVSVSDDLFILGTSKTLSEDVYESTLKANGKAKEPGIWIDADGQALWDFCEVWIDVYEKKKAAKEELERDDRKKDEGEEGEKGDEVPARPEAEAEAEALTDLKKRRAKVEAQLEAEQEELERFEKKFEELKKEKAPGDAPPAEGGEEAVPEEEAPEAIPTIPEEPAIPQAEVENPLLKELQGDGVEEGGKLDPAAEEKLRVEIEDLLEEEIDADELQFEGPFASLFDLPEPEVLRAILEKVRVLRSLHYRRWVVDGVPRGSLRFTLGNP